jgi:hypothetical protein
MLKSSAGDNPIASSSAVAREATNEAMQRTRSAGR